MDSTIFIDNAPFVADEETIRLVSVALKKDGWAFRLPSHWSPPPLTFRFENQQKEHFSQPHIIFNGSVHVHKKIAQDIVDYAAKIWDADSNEKLTSECTVKLEFVYVDFQNIINSPINATFYKPNREMDCEKWPMLGLRVESITLNDAGKPNHHVRTKFTRLPIGYKP